MSCSCIAVEQCFSYPLFDTSGICLERSVLIIFILTFIRRGNCFISSFTVFCLDWEGFFPLRSNVWRKMWLGRGEFSSPSTMNSCSSLPHRKLSSWRHQPQEGLPVWEKKGVSLTATVVPWNWFTATCSSALKSCILTCSFQILSKW